METTGTQTIQATPQAQEANPTPGQAGVTPTGAGNGPTATSIKEAAAEAKRKLKIDDQEVDEDEVIKIYKDRKGHQRVANKELQEGRAAKKQAEEFISMMKDKQQLFDVLKKMGHDPRQLSEEYLAAVLEDEMMDPKERESRDLRKKVQTYEQKEKEAQEQARAKADAETKKQLSEQYSKQFIEALTQAKLPPTKEMVSQMAGYMLKAAKLKMEMTPAEAAKLVHQDEDARIAHRLQNATPEELFQIIKEEGLQKIRGYDTSRLKDPNSVLQTPKEQGEFNRKRDTSTRMTPQQWREFNRK